MEPDIEANRTLPELLKTFEPLTDPTEASALRTFCASTPFIPEQHLGGDPYGILVLENDLDGLQKRFEARVQYFSRQVSSSTRSKFPAAAARGAGALKSAPKRPPASAPAQQMSQTLPHRPVESSSAQPDSGAGEPRVYPHAMTPARAAAIHELSTLRWSPARLPVYNVILALIHLYPLTRNARLAMARWLAFIADVPVHGVDASGATALMRSISTKPYCDTGFAETMLFAGADMYREDEVNRMNRWGETAAAEILQPGPGAGEGGKGRKAERALRWWVRHGGNLDRKDLSGFSPRMVLQRLRTRGMRDGVLRVLEDDERMEERMQADALKLGGDNGRWRKKVKEGKEGCMCRSTGRYLVCCGRPMEIL